MKTEPQSIDFLLVRIPGLIGTDKPFDYFANPKNFLKCATKVADDITAVSGKCRNLKIDGNPVDKVKKVVLTGDIKVENVQIEYISCNKVYSAEYKLEEFLRL